MWKEESPPPECVAEADSLLLPSLSTAAFALLIHPSAGVPIARPISFELRSGNPLAYLTLVGLAWILVAVARRFWRTGHHVSAAVCGLCLGFLVVIPCTDPLSHLHNFAYLGLVGVAMSLFLVWALDTFDFVQVLPPFAPVALGLPFHAQLGVGGFQLLVIGSMLVALNLTCRHLEMRNRR